MANKYLMKIAGIASLVEDGIGAVKGLIGKGVASPTAGKIVNGATSGFNAAKTDITGRINDFKALSPSSKLTVGGVTAGAALGSGLLTSGGSQQKQAAENGKNHGYGVSALAGAAAGIGAGVGAARLLTGRNFKAAKRVLRTMHNVLPPLNKVNGPGKALGRSLDRIINDNFKSQISGVHRVSQKLAKTKAGLIGAATGVGTAIGTHAVQNHSQQKQASEESKGKGSFVPALAGIAAGVGAGVGAAKFLKSRNFRVAKDILRKTHLPVVPSKRLKQMGEGYQSYVQKARKNINMAEQFKTRVDYNDAQKLVKGKARTIGIGTGIGTAIGVNAAQGRDRNARK